MSSSSSPLRAPRSRLAVSSSADSLYGYLGMLSASGRTDGRRQIGDESSPRCSVIKISGGPVTFWMRRGALLRTPIQARTRRPRKFLIRTNAAVRAAYQPGRGAFCACREVQAHRSIELQAHGTHMRIAVVGLRQPLASLGMASPPFLAATLTYSALPHSSLRSLFAR